MSSAVVGKISSAVVDKIMEYIAEKVFQPVERHVDFLFHYKKNLKNLEDEMNNLQQQRSNVQEKVNQAEHRGEAIDNDVLVWLQDADKARQEVETFMNEKIVKEIDFSRHYGLSKQAVMKVDCLKLLSEKGSKFGTVSHPREDPPERQLPSSRDYEDFHSRERVFQGIVEALKDPEVSMIGVYGTGGVGKTTMAEKVGKLLKEDGTFDEVVTAVVSHDANVIRIQGQLADRLNITFGAETEVRRGNQLWKRLDNGKKNLIILDDVWRELDLMEIGIPTQAGKKRCKVVLTSRNQDVWKNMDVHKDFHVEFLSEEEGWTLFKKKVGNHVDSHDQPLRDIALAVCKECRGLPVAINALGAALKGRDIYAWQDARDKLKNSLLKDVEGINPKLYASLKLSYDLLDSEDAKSCFLLCCLFPEDYEIPIDDLVRYYISGKTLRYHQMPNTLEKALSRVRTVVDTLKRSCLLLDRKNEHFVKVHDVVRDVAISIAEDEKSFLVEHGVRYWPEKATYKDCSVISLMPHDMSEFPNELVCPELHTLRLDCTINKSQLQVPDGFFSGMEKLLVLDLKGLIMLPLLPTSFKEFAELQMLCLDRCNLGDITILKDLKVHLEILSLRGSNIKVLPPEVGELARLRLLDMSDCRELGMIPKGVISKLLRLEELYMPQNFHQWEGTSAEREICSVSLDELMLLTQLTTLYICIQDPTLLLKNDLFFGNLVRFRIIVGEGFYFHWGPAGVLRLNNVHVANAVEYLLGKPRHERSIERNGLYPSTSFSHLGELRVTDCMLKYLFSPSSARGLVQLKNLQIERCWVMEGVIGIEGEKDEDIMINFSRLDDLLLVDLPILISFYPKKKKTATNSESSSTRAQAVLFNDKVAFPALERLFINFVPKVMEIWNKQISPIPQVAAESSFGQLSSMRIHCCENLINVVGGYPQMEVIVMEKQKGKHDDGYVSRFPKLSYLELSNLQNLESFCSRSIKCEAQIPLFDHQVAFPALERLFINFVPKVMEIWNKQISPIPQVAAESSFGQLSSMRIHCCENLINVVGGYPQMEVIVMEKQKGKHDDGYVSRFPKLSYLELSNLQNLESFCSRSIKCEAQIPLFDHQVAFPALECLRISYLPNITDIWDKKICSAQSFCPPRHSLFVNHCDKLVNVVPFNMLPKLRNLVALCLTRCPMVEVVVDLEKKEEETQEAANNTIVPFPELRSMELGGLPNVKGFCAFRSEEQLVFNAQVAFPKLNTLLVGTSGETALRQFMDASELSLNKLELSTVVSPHLFRSLRLVKELSVGHYRGAREVFNFDEQGAGEGPVCIGRLRLENLPQVTCLWNKDPHRLLVLQSLTSLVIYYCPLLANLLTVSVAKALGGLKELRLGYCSTIEEVISMDEGHASAIDDDEIEFPKLEFLMLKNLSNLKSFCSSNHNLNFPSLKRVLLKKCPKLQAFTSGSVCMSLTLYTYRRNNRLEIEDLNKHLQQQHLEGEETILEDGICDDLSDAIYGGDREEFYFLSDSDSDASYGSDSEVTHSSDEQQFDDLSDGTRGLDEQQFDDLSDGTYGGDEQQLSKKRKRNSCEEV